MDLSFGKCHWVPKNVKEVLAVGFVLDEVLTYPVCFVDKSKRWTIQCGVCGLGKKRVSVRVGHFLPNKKRWLKTPHKLNAELIFRLPNC